MVGGEHENPLAPAARPQPVSEVQEAGERDRVHTILAGAGAASTAHFMGGAVVALPPARIALLPVAEVDGAVDVLDHDYGFGTGFHQELPQLGIGVHLRQFQIVHVVAEKIGHGGDHTGFPGAGRSVQEVTSLPGAAGLLVECLAV